MSYCKKLHQRKQCRDIALMKLMKNYQEVNACPLLSQFRRIILSNTIQDKTFNYTINIKNNHGKGPYTHIISYTVATAFTQSKQFFRDVNPVMPNHEYIKE